MLALLLRDCKATLPPVWMQNDLRAGFCLLGSESMSVCSLTHDERISRSACILGLAFTSVYRDLIMLPCLSRDATLSRHRGIRLECRVPPFSGAIGSRPSPCSSSIHMYMVAALQETEMV